MTAPSSTHGTSTTPLPGDTTGAAPDRAIAAWPDREALADVPSGRRWTCAEFGAAVGEAARGLPAKGAEKGDRAGTRAVDRPGRVLARRNWAPSARSGRSTAGSRAGCGCRTPSP